MSEELEIFLDAAMRAGVAQRLRALGQDLDRAIASYSPDRDIRYRRRLESQRLRIKSPDLR